ncbi:hypothetical protein SAMN06265795_103104 [Noviherbaspirillum humi]|uniref:Uncharacterized protein n=1 Tax=Noviherbaspirillum humi TaxID=1688639 RepID=A0A239F0H5_9BURK|nr:hypothetical protein [Noviherbaspirillum humi]SNS50201.1 hypothetical protein SAMN06265795_103104 [Noviherbaspirillum humi]
MELKQPVSQQRMFCRLLFSVFAKFLALLYVVSIGGVLVAALHAMGLRWTWGAVAVCAFLLLLGYRRASLAMLILAMPLREPGAAPSPSPSARQLRLPALSLLRLGLAIATAAGVIAYVLSLPLMLAGVFHVFHMSWLASFALSAAVIVFLVRRRRIGFAR